MTNQYWLKREGKVYGPYSGGKIKKLAGQGKIGPNDQISADKKSWQLSGTVRGLFPSPGERDQQLLQESGQHQRIMQPDSATSAKSQSVGVPSHINGRDVRRVLSSKVWLMLGIVMVAGLVTTVVIWYGGRLDEPGTPSRVATESGETDQESTEVGHTTTDCVWTRGKAEEAAMTEIMAFLNNGGKIDGAYYHKERLTPLQWACIMGYARVAGYLLERGADVAARGDGTGRTPLCYAAGWGHTSIVKLLLERGTSPNAKHGDDQTPLEVTGSNGNMHTVRILIAHGADPEQLGWSLAHKAVADSSIAIVRKLKNVEIDKTDRFGLQASQLAAMAGETDILTALLDRGANIHIRTKSSGRSLLSLAARWGHLSTVRMLLDRGLRVDILDKKEMTPLHNSKVNSNVTALLIRKGAEINARDSRNRTPLHYVWTGPVARELINAKADVDATDKDGRTPLHMGNTRAVVEELLIAGADPNRRDSRGRTPLYSAPLASIVEVV